MVGIKDGIENLATLFINGIKKLFVPTKDISEIGDILSKKFTVVVDFSHTFEKQPLSLSLNYAGLYQQELVLDSDFISIFRQYSSAFVYLSFAILSVKKIYGFFGGE